MTTHHLTIAAALLMATAATAQNRPASPCLAANTKIAITDTTARSIEEIRQGDAILAYDPETKQTYTTKVVQTAVAPHDNIICYTFDDGSHITATDDHPFLTTGGWASSNPKKSAQQTGFGTISTMTTDSQIITPDGSTKQLAAISRPSTPKIRTYTILKLEKGNIFFANGCAVATEARQ